VGELTHSCACPGCARGSRQDEVFSGVGSCDGGVWASARAQKRVVMRSGSLMMRDGCKCDEYVDDSEVGVNERMGIFEDYDSN
jgi:hypothetical protein